MKLEFESMHLRGIWQHPDAPKLVACFKTAEGPRIVKGEAIHIAMADGPAAEDAAAEDDEIVNADQGGRGIWSVLL